MVTIRDIAKEASVSVATVSYVLNNVRDQKISDRTRSRVLEVASQLNYVKTRRGKKGPPVFSLIVKNVYQANDIGYCPKFFRYLENNAKAYGVVTSIIGADQFENSDDLFLSRIIKENVQGVVFAEPMNETFLKRLIEHNIPVVLAMGTGVSTMGESCVTVDYRLAGEIAARHFEKSGHRRVGMIMGMSAVQKLQAAGFCETVAGLGLELVDEWCFSAEKPTFADAKNWIVDAMDKSVPRPTAMFCGHDLLSIGVQLAFRGMGLPLPEECSVLGVGDIDECMLTFPELSTIDLRPDLMARRILGLLKEHAENPGPSKIVKVEPELIRRDSVAKLA